MPNVVILGSTGSIGTQTLDVLRHLPDFRVYGLSAGSNYQLLRKQIGEQKPAMACISNSEHAAALGREFSRPSHSDSAGLRPLVNDPKTDLVVVAVVGAVAGNPLAAFSRRKEGSGKETLVAGGHLVMSTRSDHSSIDSEHSALWNLFSGRSREDIAKLFSPLRGPLRSYLGSFDRVTMKSLSPPRWNMGARSALIRPP